MSSGARLPIAALLGATLTFLVAASAYAVEPAKTNHAAAEELFVEGLALLDAGKTALACEKLERSQAIEGSAGTLLNLADCYEKVGRFASAWSAFRQAAAASSDRRRPDWERTAVRRAAALQPKLSTVTVAVGNETKVAGLVVTCDGVAIEAAAFGVPVPKDPGAHVVTARAPGHKPWQTEVRVGQGPEKHTIDVPRLELEPASPHPTPPPPPPPPPKSFGAMRTTSVVLGASGLVAVGAGATFGLLASSALDDAKAACASYPTTGGADCNARDADGHNDDAKRNALVSTVAFAAGGALLVGAGVLWFLAPSSATSSGQLRVVPAFGATSVGVGVTGAL